ncbi:MAG: galactose mutarotase [Ruminococcaceae bacterium]|nr:galactose mutarotase [Oscillospiraceae bacterium]
MIEKNLFGKMPDGTEVYAYTFGNDFVKATVLNLGGIIHKLEVDGVDVVCAYGNVNDILEGSGYHGAIIGRYGNRIKDGKFTLNGKEYQLEKNERGVTHLHGGKIGFNHRIFSVAQIVEPDCEKLVLSLFSPDGEEGYPGNLDVSVTYKIKGGDFSIHYTGESDADTVLNMTNHAYFNLNGYDSGTVMGHKLAIYADKISEVDTDLIPIGEMKVKCTPFDFNVAKEVGRDIDADDAQLKLGSGYDHNFILCSDKTEAFEDKKLTKCATLSGDTLCMDVFTDCPCVQLYTGNVMNCPIPFKGGVKQVPRNALCLETQYAPDSPNHGQSFLKAYEKYDTATLFRFSK